MTVDRARLADLAQKATPRTWDWVNAVGAAKEHYAPIELVACSLDTRRVLSRKLERSDAAYIAAADPETVLALLADLDTAEQRIIDERTLYIGATEQRDELMPLKKALADALVVGMTAHHRHIAIHPTITRCPDCAVLYACADALAAADPEFAASRRQAVLAEHGDVS